MVISLDPAKKKLRVGEKADYTAIDMSGGL